MSENLSSNKTTSKISNEIRKNTNTYFSNREIKYLSTILKNDEEIKCAIRYSNTKSSRVDRIMVCTNKQLIFFKAGIFETYNSSILMEKVDFLETDIGMFSASITINYNSGNKILYLMDTKNVIKFANIINEQINSYKTIKIQNTQITQENFIDQISRLADLYKNGTLTEYEFSMKKQELLNKVSKN